MAVDIGQGGNANEGGGVDLIGETMYEQYRSTCLTHGIRIAPWTSLHPVQRELWKSFAENFEWA